MLKLGKLKRLDRLVKAFRQQVVENADTIEQDSALTASIISDILPEVPQEVSTKELFAVVRIGHQLWTAEDIDLIPAEGKSWKIADGARLYDWTAATVLCPDGWRLPTDDDWVKLECSLGMPPREAFLRMWGWRNGGNVGERMRESGDCGLNMRMNGYCTDSGVMYEQGECGWWWSSTASGNCVITRGLTRRKAGVFRTYNSPESGRSVRYVKDIKIDPVRQKR